MTDIVIIGSGHVANAMGRKILESGHSVSQVVARNKIKGEALARLLQADFTADLSHTNQHAFMCIVAISDDALPELRRNLTLDRMLVVHTAGAVTISALEKVSKNFGVMYPLQTLREQVADVPDFPLLVDGNTPETCTMVMDFARTLSQTVVKANDEYRRKIHLAAVASGNFANHLFALVQDYCNKEGVDFQLLLPMLREIVNKLDNHHAFNSQTGPALRNDILTLAAHRQMLGLHPELSALYEIMSSSIFHYHHPHKYKYS